eukprot:PLAT11352.1.p1 GENE.PLAT11352.1~~PLAT11352.1.p1  ORF type:complete len:870 (-),score=309.88 PLAT11352.1:703-3312(-)
MGVDSTAVEGKEAAERTPKRRRRPARRKPKDKRKAAKTSSSSDETSVEDVGGEHGARASEIELVERVDCDSKDALASTEMDADAKVEEVEAAEILDTDVVLEVKEEEMVEDESSEESSVADTPDEGDKESSAVDTAAVPHLDRLSDLNLSPETVEMLQEEEEDAEDIKTALEKNVLPVLHAADKSTRMLSMEPDLLSMLSPEESETDLSDSTDDSVRQSLQLMVQQEERDIIEKLTWMLSFRDKELERAYELDHFYRSQKTFRALTSCFLALDLIVIIVGFFYFSAFALSIFVFAGLLFSASLQAARGDVASKRAVSWLLKMSRGLTPVTAMSIVVLAHLLLLMCELNLASLPNCEPITQYPVQLLFGLLGSFNLAWSVYRLPFWVMALFGVLLTPLHIITVMSLPNAAAFSVSFTVLMCFSLLSAYVMERQARIAFGLRERLRWQLKRGRELEIARRKGLVKAAALKQSNEAKRQFVAYIFHEVRVPFNAIALGIKSLLLLHKELADEVRETLQLMLESAHSMERVLNDVLDMQKMEEGKLSLESDRFNLFNSVRAVLQSFSSVAEAKKVTVSCPELELREHDALLPSVIVCGDRARLRQVLRNLLSNALKFTPAASSVVVNVTAADSCDGYRFSVSDSGPGITKEDQAKLFQPYTQVGSAAKGTVGTGLGLAICRSIVETAGGEVWVESAVGDGATFCFEMPLPEVDDPSHSSTVAIDDILGSVDSDLLVLLVEDSRPSAKLLARLLRNAGYTVELAVNGQEAVQAVDSYGLEYFDFVLMDKEMPIMDGYEATRRLRDMGYDRPILGVTANALREDQAEFISHGVDAVVTKPVNLAKLARLLRELPRTDGHRVRRRVTFAEEPSSAA